MLLIRSAPVALGSRSLVCSNLPGKTLRRHQTMSGRNAYEVMMGSARAEASANKGRAPLSKGKNIAAQPAATPTTTAAATAASISDDVDRALQSLRVKNFDPKQAVFWRENEPVPFLFLAKVLDMISNIRGRLLITEILCNAFRTVIATRPKDLLPIVYLSANKIAPAHEGIELGIADAGLIRALAEAYGRKEDQLKTKLKALGDLGLVAQDCRSKQTLISKPNPLTCVGVFETFRGIAKESGKDSQEKKRNRIKGLLVAATDCEPQYIVRLLQAKLRIGIQEATVLVALAQAAVYSERPQVPSSQLPARLQQAGHIIKECYNFLPTYDRIVPALLAHGILKLPETCSFTLGVPIAPMLSKPTKGVTEILNKFQDMTFTCEYKYDGERAQIHGLADGSIEIFSRNAERNTGKYPDIISSFSRFKKPEVSTFVLDGEIVAYDKKAMKILPFQVLSTRARKAVAESAVNVGVCLFAFDLLYLNGEVLLQEQLSKRRELLKQSFMEVPGDFHFSTFLNSADIEEIQIFLNDAVNNCCEGLIVKTLDREATYEPAKRSNNWLKLKKDYMDAIGDSLDLVPIGAFHGRGKRTGVYGAFLLACYDPDKEEYQSVCKIGTGFSEQVLTERSNSLKQHIIEEPKPYYRYGQSLGADVWFDAVEVWEVKAADLSISPVHQACIGMVDSSRGISLRFPRLVRVRPDKKPEEATSSEQVAELFRSQKINHGYDGGAAVKEEAEEDEEDDD